MSDCDNTAIAAAAQFQSVLDRIYAFIAQDEAHAGGSVDDPDSFDAEGNPGGGGYYPRTLPDGSIAYVPSIDRIVKIALASASSISTGYAVVEDLPAEAEPNALAHVTTGPGAGIYQYVADAWEIAQWYVDAVAAAFAPIAATAESAADRAETALTTVIAQMANVVPFLFPDQLDAALKRVVDVDLYSSVNGVALTWPQDIKVERVGRQAVTNRAQYRIGGRNGADPFTMIARESIGGANFVSVAGLEGVIDFPLYANDASLGVPAGTEVARIAWEVTDPTSTYGQAYDYEDSGLNRARLFLSIADKQRIGELIASALATEAAREGPFVASVRNARLRDDFEDVRGVFTQPDHRYGFSSVELADFSATLGYWRAQVTVRDWLTGADVAQRTKLFYEDPRGATQHLFLHKGTLAGFTGLQFVVAIKPGAQWLDAGGARTFASYAETGFREDRMATSSQVESFLDQGPPPSDQDVIIKASGGDATTLAAAKAPFYNAGYNAAPDAQKFSAYPNSDIASFWHKLRFYLADPYHDEEAGRVVALWHSIIQGRGMFNTRFWNDDPALRVFETTWPQWKVDLAVEQFANQYGDHIDQAGGQSKPATVGDAIQHAFLDQGWLRCWYRAHGADATNGAPSCVGMGGSSGQRQRIISSLFEQVGGGASIPAMFIHTSPGSTRGGFLSIEQGSILRTKRANQQALQLLGSHGQSVFTEIYVSADSHVENGIVGGVLMGDADANMPAIARARWPYRVRGHLPDGITFSDPKMRVLTLDAGTTVSTASGVAKALFGNGYDAQTGQGEALTLDGSVQALATKLNGLQGSTMSLARDGVAAEAITIGNYSGMSEGAIVAALNAQLTNFNIASVRIDDQVEVEA